MSLVWQSSMPDASCPLWGLGAAGPAGHEAWSFLLFFFFFFCSIFELALVHICVLFYKSEECVSLGMVM